MPGYPSMRPASQLAASQLRAWNGTPNPLPQNLQHIAFPQSGAAPAGTGLPGSRDLPVGLGAAGWGAAGGPQPGGAQAPASGPLPVAGVVRLTKLRTGDRPWLRGRTHRERREAWRRARAERAPLPVENAAALAMRAMRGGNGRRGTAGMLSAGAIAFGAACQAGAIPKRVLRAGARLGRNWWYTATRWLRKVTGCAWATVAKTAREVERLYPAKGRRGSRARTGGGKRRRKGGR